MVERLKSMRKGGRCAGKVTRTVNPSRQLAHTWRFSSAPSGFCGSGNVFTIALTSSLSQECKTAFVQRVTPLMRASPVAGWNKVTSLAVPLRRYSCGSLAGSPSGC